MSLAAVAAGADGLMIEVHNDPPRALCDGRQSLTPEAFASLGRGYRVGYTPINGRSPDLSSTGTGPIIPVDKGDGRFEDDSGAGISNDVAMQVVGVGFIIGVLQDSAETALNSSTDVLFTAAACMASRRA